MKSRIVTALSLVLAVSVLLPRWAVPSAESQTRGETIAIIGTGNVGSTLGKIWAEAGHTVIYGSRTPNEERVLTLVTETGHGGTVGLGSVTGGTQQCF